MTEELAYDKANEIQTSLMQTSSKELFTVLMGWITALSIFGPKSNLLSDILKGPDLYIQ